MDRRTLAIGIASLFFLPGCVGIIEPAAAVVDVTALPVETYVSGETASLDVTLHNPGWRATSGSLSLLLDGRPVQRVDYEIDGRKSQTIAVEFTPASWGNVTLGVRTIDGGPSATLGKVRILRAGLVEVRAVVVPPKVLGGTQPALVLDVANPGETPATQRVALTLGGVEVASELIELQPGERRFIALPFAAEGSGARVLEIETGGKTLARTTRVIEAPDALREGARDIVGALRGASNRIIGLDGSRGADAVSARIGSNGVLKIAIGKLEQSTGADCIVSTLGYGLAALFSLGLILITTPSPTCGGNQGGHPPTTVLQPRASFYCANGILLLQAGSQVAAQRQSKECTQLTFEGFALGDLVAIASGQIEPDRVVAQEDSLVAVYHTRAGQIVEITVGPEGPRRLVVRASSGTLDALVAYGNREAIHAPAPTLRLPAYLQGNTSRRDQEATWTLVRGDDHVPALDVEVRVVTGSGTASFKLDDGGMFGNGVSIETFGTGDATLEAGDGFVLRGDVRSFELWDLWAGKPIAGTSQSVTSTLAATPGAGLFAALAALAFVAWVARRR